MLLIHILRHDPLTWDRYDLKWGEIWIKTGSTYPYSEVGRKYARDNRARADSFMLTAVMEYESKKP
jgi:hypothetical protein